jgi:hypothetical protein
MRKHYDVYSMCWSGDDPGSLWCAGLACGRTNGCEARHVAWLYRSRKRCDAIPTQVIFTSLEAPEVTWMSIRFQSRPLFASDSDPS